jgi:MFS family permease
VYLAGLAMAGVGAAALLPSTLALISHAVPDPRKRATFVGLWAAPLMAALAVGPMIAGVILDHTAWRWIFLPTVPVAVITLAVAFPLVTDSRAPGDRRLDWPGQITAAVAISALVYGVIEGGASSVHRGGRAGGIPHMAVAWVRAGVPVGPAPPGGPPGTPPACGVTFRRRAGSAPVRPGSVCTQINREYGAAAIGPSSSCFTPGEYGTWTGVHLLDPRQCPARSSVRRVGDLLRRGGEERQGGDTGVAGNRPECEQVSRPATQLGRRTARLLTREP